MNARLPVNRTAKLFVGGAFPRSESGRSYVVNASDGAFLANVAQASRKDVRDAVVAARGAQPGWAAASAYNRGQVLYRVAEIMEGRRDQFTHDVAAAEGLDRDEAAATVDASIDRWVWYAGWSDKFAQVDGGANPVAGPYFNLSTPEPVGVVGIIAPQASSLLGLVSVLAPAIVGGSSVVVLASELRPLPGVGLAEVLATSDVPGGVVNLLTGRTVELAGVLAAHLDINAIDLTGVEGSQAAALELAAAENVKRVIRPEPAEPDFAVEPAGPERILALCETKTVWHPKGM